MKRGKIKTSASCGCGVWCEPKGGWGDERSGLYRQGWRHLTLRHLCQLPRVSSPGWRHLTLRHPLTRARLVISRTLQVACVRCRLHALQHCCRLFGFSWWRILSLRHASARDSPVFSVSYSDVGAD